MKSNLVLLLTLLFASIGCNDKSKRQKSMEDDVHPSDSACKTEITTAKSDIKNKKFVYCHYVGNIIYQPLRAENEMHSLLKQNGIEYQNEGSPCEIEENRNYHCYCEFMQEKINEKFGKNFTDSLLYLADSLWALKNRDIVFDCESDNSCWDRPALFPGDSIYDQTNHSGLQKEFEKRVKYPTDYRIKNGKNSMAHIRINLDIDENGKAKVNNIEVVFWDYVTKEEDYNKKHLHYLKRNATSIIETTTWTPATIKNIGVKSKNTIFIYLK